MQAQVSIMRAARLVTTGTGAATGRAHRGAVIAALRAGLAPLGFPGLGGRVIGGDSP